MTRVLIESFMLFLLPTAFYLAAAFLTRRAETSATMVVARAPMLTLGLLGASLVFAVITVFGNTGEGKPGQAYEPAVFKDGQVVPGRMK